MLMSEKIREKRKELGLTQEQVAECLNVSAPAVNKWEKGVTSPDITLVPALARLLKTDLNELFGFHENLSMQEIGQFLNELGKIVADETGKVIPERIAAGMETARRKLSEYPNCYVLIHQCALFVEGVLIMSGLPGEEKEAYEEEILSWYERAAHSEDKELQNTVSFMLANKYIQRGELQKAQQIIWQLPKRSAIDRRTLEVSVLEKQNKPEEAIVIMQRKLYQSFMEVQGDLSRLTALEIAAGNMDRARGIAEISQKAADVFQFWGYFRGMAMLDVALKEKDAQESIRLIDEMISQCFDGWDIRKSLLYDRMEMGSISEAALRIVPPLLAELQTDEKYDFLRADEAFEKMLRKFEARCKK